MPQLHRDVSLNFYFNVHIAPRLWMLEYGQRKCFFFFNLKAEVISSLSNYEKKYKDTGIYENLYCVTLDFKQNEHYSHF